MALIDIDWKPSQRVLRQFGGIMLVGCAVMGAVLRWLGHPSAGMAVWGFGAVVGPVGLIVPTAAKPVYLLLTVLSWPIGWVMSHVILGVFYYGVITPIGLVFRLMGRDALQLKRHAGVTTYWHPKVLPGSGEKKRYFRQF